MVKPTRTSKSEPGLKSIFHDRHKNCQITELSEYQLGNMTNPTAYSVDCLFQRPPGRGGVHCDEFVFCVSSKNETGLYLVERKTNSQDVTEVKKQLQGGADFIQDFMEDDPSTDNCPFDFMPVLVSKGIANKLRSRLRTATISLKGKFEPIEHCKTGNELPLI